MSDKEPRRRKKRKDMQPPRKEDVHATDDHFFMPSKSETKDSDQELEEEVVISTHQPSVFAKFVFVLLFSGLVISLSFIFISLHGTDRGDVDIFNGHSEEIHAEVPHDEHDVHGHDDHDHEDHDPDIHDHDDNDIHNQDDHDHDDDHEEASEGESLQETLADFFPSLSSILSFNDEHSKEPLEESVSDDNVVKEELSDEPDSELPVPSSTDEYISSTNQDSIEDDAEDTEQSTETTSSEIYPDATEETVSFFSDIFYTEPPSEQDYEESPEPEEEEEDDDDEEEISENTIRYSTSYVTEAEPSESVTESYMSPVIEDVSPTTPTVEEKDEQLFYQDDSDNFIDVPTENTMDEEVTYYEKESITNEEDFKIRNQLDDLDELLQKEYKIDDNDNDDVDDDDEYDDEGAGDEFDFWQF